MKRHIFDYHKVFNSQEQLKRKQEKINKMATNDYRNYLESGGFISSAPISKMSKTPEYDLKDDPEAKPEIKQVTMATMPEEGESVYYSGSAEAVFTGEPRVTIPLSEYTELLSLKDNKVETEDTMLINTDGLIEELMKLEIENKGLNLSSDQKVDLYDTYHDLVFRFRIGKDKPLKAGNNPW